MRDTIEPQSWVALDGTPLLPTPTQPFRLASVYLHGIISRPADDTVPRLRRMLRRRIQNGWWGFGYRGIPYYLKRHGGRRAD